MQKVVINMNNNLKEINFIIYENDDGKVNMNKN